MKTEMLEYASAQIYDRRPWWALQVVGFAGLAFVLGMAFDAIYCHIHKQTDVEALFAPDFSILLFFQKILGCYSFFAMGLASFARSRRFCVVAPWGWAMLFLAAATYGAIPVACDALDNVPLPGVALITAVTGFIPLLMPFVLLRSVRDWAG